MAKKALYLAGGGARGAYQAGVLKAIEQILKTKTFPFDTISGVSVGSINAAVLAENADDFQLGIEKLESIWASIHCTQIYKASNYELGKSVFRNLSTLIMRQRQAGHLLDTTPLRQFVDETIDFRRIEENIKNKHLGAFEIITNCYETHQTVSFFDFSMGTVDDWNYPRHKGKATKLAHEHILASGALPLFFPPVTIDGFHYGDGSIGLVAPLRGAIRFQVDRIMILGTRELPELTERETLRSGDIAFAHILGNMMNGLFLDNLDRDIEMVNRMNEISTLLSIWKKHRSPWRPISTLHLRPSRDVASLAQGQYQNLPTLLRYLLNILGARSHSGDLLSFLLFEKEFTRELLDLGYQDTIASAAIVEQFFS